METSISFISNLLFTILIMPMAFSQDLNRIQEFRYSTIGENDLEIIHQDTSVAYGEDFSSVIKKWTDAKYAGKFTFVHGDQDEYYYGIADYKMIFDNAYFFFVERKLTYFRIASDEFQLKLQSQGGNFDTVLFTIGHNDKFFGNTFERSYVNRMSGNEQGSYYVFNLGRFKGGAANFNDLIVTISKTGIITGFIYYGHF